MQAVILAGGKGTRLSQDAEAPPKPLVKICGVPLLDHILGWLAPQGVDDVVLLTAYRAAYVEEVMGHGERHGVRIRYSVETSPLGTAGAVKAAEHLLKDRFLVVYGDVLADVDIGLFWQAHLAGEGLATLLVHPNDHPMDSDRVVTNRHGVIERMVRKEDHAGPEAGALCNAALYVLEKRLLAEIPADGKPRDFARDVFPALVSSGKRLLAYRSAEYLKDMGTLTRLQKVEGDLRSGVPASMRRSTPRPAVLMDRDGVLIQEEPFLTRKDKLVVMPGVVEAITRLNKARVLSVCCTNQPVVARGDITEDGLHELHRYMEGKLGEGGAWLDDIFTCPHHPDRGYPQERVELKVPCNCRKPQPGLIFQAEAALGVDRRASIFVGDRTTDMLAARAAGVLPVGVMTGVACKDGKHPLAPEIPLLQDLAQAVGLMLDTAPSWDPFLEEARSARVVLIGGGSRSGKTVAANALRLRLQTLGIPVLHVSLDRYIQPASTRKVDSTLRERIRFEDTREAVARLATCEPVLMPGYNPVTRERAASAVVQWSGKGVLVVDGLLAHALDVPGALKVVMRADAEALRERRRAFYVWKGLAPSEIDAAVDGRAEEHDTVASTLGLATLHLALDGQLRIQGVA
ncbi:MAG: HAD-IIIA family hydrolase [Myxococcota bacterium]